MEVGALLLLLTLATIVAALGAGTYVLERWLVGRDLDASADLLGD